jgi:secondary thiamine-phosphate synthase enzyme
LHEDGSCGKEACRIEQGREKDAMGVAHQRILVKTTAGTDIIDLTERVAGILHSSTVEEGAVLLFIPGSTAALTTIEYESGAVHDLKKAIERMAPEDLYYEHNERWGDGNGYAHVRAALLGPSLHIPVAEGRMTLGTWQQIVLLDFDNRPRERRILVQITGQSNTDKG